MNNFVCVGGAKYGCDLFSEGSNGKIVTVDEALSDISLPLCWAGSHKETLYKHCLKYNRKFYNLDTGYFGNIKKKEIIRISINDFQDQGPIIKRSSHRLDALQLQLEHFTRGSSVVIVPPDEKIAKSFQLKDNWTNNVEKEIKRFTDRPIRIRNRPLSRHDRINLDTFKDFIKQDTYVVVGYSSNSLVEAAMCGIPVIALGHSAVKSLYDVKLENIENLETADTEKVRAWLAHLSYRQFTHEELKNGTAWELLNESMGVWSRS